MEMVASRAFFGSLAEPAVSPAVVTAASIVGLAAALAAFSTGAIDETQTVRHFITLHV